MGGARALNGERTLGQGYSQIHDAQACLPDRSAMETRRSQQKEIVSTPGGIHQAGRQIDGVLGDGARVRIPHKHSPGTDDPQAPPVDR